MSKMSMMDSDFVGSKVVCKLYWAMMHWTPQRWMQERPNDFSLTLSKTMFPPPILWVLQNRTISNVDLKNQQLLVPLITCKYWKSTICKKQQIVIENGYN